MQAFPLVRVKWSNEHIMAALFGVLILYMLPGWLDNPGNILDFIVLLVAALLIDTVVNVITKKQVLCSVSAAVTAAILQILTPGIPLYGRLLGILAALLLGKHFWGGTGKNPINPALTGIVFMCVFFPMNGQVFTASALLLPAILLSLPFIIFRPYAAVGFMAGMTISLLLAGNFSSGEFISTGIIFWSCIIITDPVTITPNPLIGGVIGVLGGFLALFFTKSIFIIAVIILTINLFSSITEKLENKLSFKRLYFFIPKKIKTILIPYPKFHDLSDKENQDLKEQEIVDTKEILKKIEINEVFGFGGAGFPTVGKINTVIESKTPKKHFIVNAIECDPGLLHDKWLLNNKFEEIKRGIGVLSKCINFASVTIAVKTSTDLSLLQNNYTSNSFVFKKIPDYFPVGAEKILIKEVLGKTLDAEVIPAKEGILVLNLQTVFAVYEAVYYNKKADTRYITVADMYKKSGYIVKVKLGMSIQAVIDAIIPHGGISFYGGGAMQCINTSEEDVVDKNTNFIAVSKHPNYKESMLCSQCGFCKIICPSGLAVNKIAKLIDNNQPEKTLKLSPKNCLQCGRCSSVCLAGRNLSNRIKIAKEYDKKLNLI